MSTVRDLLATKGNHVLSVGPKATVLDAAVLMNDHKIGSLVVLDQSHVIGIITERDILQRVVAQHRDPAATTVEQIMTDELVCCAPHTTVDEARFAMKTRRIRHLPVIDVDGSLHGMISIGDLNAHQAVDQEQTIHYLQEYLYGRC
jgi:CBS domain-containing protein